MGFWNDLVMRGSIPPLFVVFTYLAYELNIAVEERTNRIRLFLAGMFLVGALTGASEMLRSLIKFSYKPPAVENVKNFITLDPIVLLQRKGDGESFFFRKLAKQKTAE